VGHNNATTIITPRMEDKYIIVEHLSPRGLPSSGMLRLMAPVRTYVSEERIASIIGVTRVGDLGAMLAVTNNRNMLLVIKKNTETLIDDSNEGGLK
jgi:hypothetical protein